MQKLIINMKLQKLYKGQRCFLSAKKLLEVNHRLEFVKK